MSAPRNPVCPRQLIIAKLLFALYNSLVLGFSNRFVWNCPTKRLQSLYNAHISTNHLEAGAGTGYFIDRCRFPAHPDRLVLLDINGYCLAETAHRLLRYHPVAYRRSILEPLDIQEGFDSVGINYVLHCLPGTIESKATVFEHLRRVMNKGAVLFGSTTLYHGVYRNILARGCMTAYNRLGIFSNEHDSFEGLQKALSLHFSEVSLEIVGCSGLFVCRA